MKVNTLSQVISRANVEDIAMAIAENGLPGLAIQEHLGNRRAGIETLIGRVKQGSQLGRSSMKFDTKALAARYTSVLGFNLRQLSRKQRQGKKQAA